MKTLNKVTGLALWDHTYTATLLYCVPCFNERLTASAAVALGERVVELLGGAASCSFCGEVLI